MIFNIFLIFLLKFFSGSMCVYPRFPLKEKTWLCDMKKGQTSVTPKKGPKHGVVLLNVTSPCELISPISPPKKGKAVTTGLRYLSTKSATKDGGK